MAKASPWGSIPARDVTARKEAEARQLLLIRELQHRTKNLLAVIQSIASNTLSHSRILRAQTKRWWADYMRSHVHKILLLSDPPAAFHCVILLMLSCPCFPHA
jgi:hypothetical protein